MALEFVLTGAKRYLICALLAFVCVGILVYFANELNDSKADGNKRIPASDGINHPGTDIRTVSKKYGEMGEGIEHLHVFAQISDLHLSVFRDKERGPQLRQFCEEYLPVMKPEVVLLTGDITDAKLYDKQGSKQFKDEWLEYWKILHDTKITNQTVWLDIRGNHDAFDVPTLHDPKNYFRKYSHRGRNHSRSYSYHHSTKDGDSFNFVSVDACPDPGPRRPFNFFGVIYEEEVEFLQKLAASDEQSDMTIWFGHYPTSVIAGATQQLRQLLGQSLVYLCGHLHTLGGLVPNMYGLQKAGYFELELGDWMDNRMYRVFAVDHGLFSFSDQTVGTWPIVMVTNPKHGQFVFPDKEPTGPIVKSTHIRILVFSPDNISDVVVHIDNTLVGNAVHSEGPLYTLPWEPDKYLTGVHTISVTAKDKADRSATLSQPFALDGSKLPFGVLRKFIIMSRHAIEAPTLFAFAFIATVLPMVLVKCVNITLEVSTHHRGPSYFCYKMYASILRKYKILANNHSVFWPLLAFHLYVAIGPWFIGEMIDGHIGCMFVYGVVVKGTFIIGSLTFLYGFFQMVLFNLPLTIYLAHLLDLVACNHKRRLTATHSCLPLLGRWLLTNGVFFSLLVFQIYLSYTGFYKAYGILALLLCPVRTWSVPFALFLRYRTWQTTPRTRETPDH